MHRIVHVYSSIVALDSLVASIGPFIQHSYLHVCWCYNIIQCSICYSQKLSYIIYLDTFNCSYNTASQLCILIGNLMYGCNIFSLTIHLQECFPENVNTSVQLLLLHMCIAIYVWFEQYVLQ